MKVTKDHVLFRFGRYVSRSFFATTYFQRFAMADNDLLDWKAGNLCTYMSEVMFQFLVVVPLVIVAGGLVGFVALSMLAVWVLTPALLSVPISTIGLVANMVAVVLLIVIGLYKTANNISDWLYERERQKFNKLRARRYEERKPSTFDQFCAVIGQYYESIKEKYCVQLEWDVEENNDHSS